MIAAHGNAEVVTALEVLLAQAKAGRAGYLIAVMLTDGQLPTGGWFGSPTLEASAVVARDEISEMMNSDVLNRQLPLRAVDAPADRVCYNIPMSPLSFDFVNWLADAEMTRLREGAPAPLKVGFWFGRDGKTGLNLMARRQMFEKVVRPALALMGAVEDDRSAIVGRCKQFFGMKDLLDGARAGDEVPKFRAPSAMREAMAKRLGGAVTITLREADMFPHRNSNIPAWLRLADDLTARGERIVIVRDTARAHEPLGGYEICPEASIDLQWRAALYETAKMNLFVSNGPAGLSFLSDWPYITFIKIEADGHGCDGALLA
jgi:hypothetical protein